MPESRANHCKWGQQFCLSCRMVAAIFAFAVSASFEHTPD